MSDEKHNIAQLSNAFSTGSGGANFERHIQAVFALSLIIEGFSPIINAPVQKIDFQAKHLGFDVDDLIVTSSYSKLLCQIKHFLAVTENDTTFQDVINAAWSDFNKDTFNIATDKIALITGFIAKDSIHALRYIHDQSTAAPSSDAFIDRIYQAKFTASSTREKFGVIKKCIQKANNNIPASNEDIWNFCKCFLLSVFDLDYENSVNRVLIRSLIHCQTEQDANLVWSKLAEQCGDWNQQAASITRDSIPEEILALFGHRKHNEIADIISTNFSPSNIWATIALVGSWDENNEYDIAAIEKLTEINYNDFQRNCRELLLNNPDFLSLQNGKWKIKHRKTAFDIVQNFYFDNIIKSAFEIANGCTNEVSKQFSRDGEFNIVIPSTGRFSNSDGFRKGLLEGLCMLANRTALPNCTDNLLKRESRSLISSSLKNYNWINLVSISDIISIIAEMDPSSYLEYIEELIRNKPSEIEKLFPQKYGHSIIDQNFIANILFSIERLAWHENYLVPCIRCLGEMECLNYEQTNWVNTPINTIANILTPFMPQTCASIDKQKNAIQALKIDHPNLCWEVITKLLPRRGSFTIPATARPKYMQLDIPEKIEITDDDRQELLQFYIQQAISMTGIDSSKMAQLSEHTSYMQIDDILALLNKINSTSSTWNDEDKCDLWIKLSELKYQALYDTQGSKPDTKQFNALCETIDLICPQGILYQHKRLFQSFFNEFLLSENRRKEVETQKQIAIEDIYRTLGLDAVIEFGISINALHEAGSRLGKLLNTAELSEILPKYYTEKNTIFYSSLVKSFLYQNGVSAVKQLNLLSFEPALIASVLKNAPFTQELIEMVPNYLPDNEALFWETVNISPCYANFCDYDVTAVVHILLSFNRAPTALYVISQDIENLDIDDGLVCDLLMQAPLNKSSEKVDQYSVQTLIKHLQDSGKTDIETLSNIEYIYLPWLDQYSPTLPRAINYRLANDPEYFCEIMKATYKKRHETSVSTNLPQGVSERLFQLTHNYCIIPGTDWDGVFHCDKFTLWIDAVKIWAKENDRYEVVMHTVGSGLSFAKFNNDVIDSVIMAELNSVDNEDLREGYRLGTLNQRGVHWIDPDGKPEKELARTYHQRADAVEQLGYSRFAELLRNISANYLNEAEENSKRFSTQED